MRVLAACCKLDLQARLYDVVQSFHLADGEVSVPFPARIALLPASAENGSVAVTSPARQVECWRRSSKWRPGEFCSARFFSQSLSNGVFILTAVFVFLLFVVFMRFERPLRRRLGGQDSDRWVPSCLFSSGLLRLFFRLKLLLEKIF